MLFGKLSAVFVLIVGGILGVLNYYVNLLQISNSISLWLSIQPADLFFYAFLPPLLVDTAIRIDFFMFRKIWVHALFMAFVMVVLSAIALTPFILFVLGFQNRGWSWVHGALLAAIISPTDALAVASILAKANGPERVVAVMEGESLFNDASAITLFEVFAHLVYEHMSEYPTIWPSVWSVIPTILLDIVKLSVIGVAIGLAMSWATWHLLRWLRWRGARPYIETTVVLAVAYLSYYVTNSPAKGSGVIAVVVFGLYGNATSKWGMLASAEESGAFDAVWDMISFSANGLVFFWSGVASVNFFIRSADLLPRTAWSYGAIPLIYIFMMLIRCLCVALFNPVFNALGEGLSKSEIFFIGFAGLRGSVSLIMVSAFATGTRLSLANADEASMVYADISLWASAFVVLTLVINGPMIAPVLRWLKLNIVPKEKMKMRSRAKRALCRFTDQQINELRDDDDEFLQGANWDAVAQYVDLSGYIENFDYTIKTKSTKGPSTTTFSSKLKAPFRKAWAWLGTTVLWPGRDDALKVADVSTPSKQPATDIALGATTSKRLGRKKSSGSENGSALSQPTTTAVTTTSSSGGSSSSNTASPVRNLSEQQDTQKFGVYIPKESSAESPLAGAGGGGGSGSSSSDRELPSQQRPGHHHVHDPWTEITAEELAREMHEECPFFTTTEEEEQAAQGAAGGGGGGDIELGTMGGRASTSDDAVVAAALAASSSQKPSYAAVTKATPIPSLAEKAAAAAAAATAAGMASGASPPSASREGSVRRGSSINLASIIEGQPMEEQDQLCLTGTAGAKLLSELRRTMSKGEQTLPPDYYASLPAGAGAKLKQQLQQELGSLAGPSFAADSVGSGGDQEEEGDSMDGAAADYYCSLPALAGKKLQEELRQATEAAAAAERRKSLEQQPAAPSLSSPAAAAAAVSAAGALEASSFNANPDYYTSMPAAVGRNVREELQRQLAAEQAAVQIAANIGAPSPSTSSAGAGASGSAKSISTNKAPAIPSPFSELASLSTAPPPTSLPVDATTSLPAATGKAMQAELQRRLRVNVPGSSQHSRRGSVDGSSPRLSSPRISGGRPPMDYYSYHATVSGVSGSNLATELKERLRSGPLSKHGSERDLLGRKVAPKQQGNAAANLPPIPPFPSSQRPPQQPQQQQQQQQQPLRQPLGGPSSHFRSISLTADRTMAAAAPISMALLDKKKSNLHAFRRTASTVDRRRQQQQQPTDPAQLFRPSTAESQNPKDTTAATTTITENGSGSSPRGPPSSVSKKFSLTSSFLRRGAGVAADASAVPPNNDPSAMLLARTFSVGASLHRRGRPGGGVSMARSILDEDVDEDASTTSNGDGGGDDASDGAGGQRQNSAGGRSGSGRLMMDQRTISATTLREGSFDKRKDGDVFGAEEAFFEA
jgi:NhaP-type Na+/H+ or K+/H+ antiporter